MPDQTRKNAPRNLPDNAKKTPSGQDERHILVVDDENEVRNVICELIQAQGYPVIGATSGREAVQILADTPIRLILTDLMMPDVNGWQLLRVVKQKFPRIPVVLITGYIDEQGEEMLTSRQADGYLTKPVEYRRLQALLEALLNPQNLGREARVIVLDDDATTLRAVEQTLGKRGLFVTTFQDPGDALDQIREDPPDLIISDLHFPNISGFDICKAIRSDRTTVHLPILILTGNADRENVIKAVQFRVNGYIAKPFNPKELAERVMKILRQSGVKTRPPEA